MREVTEFTFVLIYILIAATCTFYFGKQIENENNPEIMDHSFIQELQV